MRWVILIAQALVVSSESCSHLYRADRWYIGRINVGGLCNTLFSVYGQVPLALLFNASLVVSEMYSRRSFADSWDTFVRQPIALSFSSFYDLDKFAAYWKKRNNLTVVEVHDRESCFSDQRIVDVTKNEASDCAPNTDCGILQKLQNSGITLPLDTSVNFIRIAPNIMVWCYYTFWQDNQHLKLLQAVHESLQPAKRIKERITSATEHFKHQNSSYWSIHLRLEPDVVHETGSNDDDFQSILQEQRQHILNSKCYRDAKDRNESLPGIYASSGIFQYSGHHNNILYSRAMQVVGMLKEIGFPAIHHGRHSVDIYPEHQALVDLYVAKQAHCFIPCFMHQPEASSSFSYMVERFRQLDAVKDLRMEHFTEISKEYDRSNVFYGWGI